jgi:DNA-binding MarR family transcriptional regulator
MGKDREEALTLEILEAIEARSDVTQRHLADRLGIALGLANSYLKRCARKGLIKVQQAPANRYLYYLTPQGFAEKSRLTKEYLSASFDFYRRAGSSLSAAFDRCSGDGAKRIIFAGVSELAEIGSLRAQDYQLEFVGTYDPDSSLDRFLREPVWHEFHDVAAFDICILTALVNTDALHRELSERLEAGRWLVPDILDGLVRRHD